MKTTAKGIKFNLNDYIRVKLTDHGREIHRKWHDSLSSRPWEYCAPLEDADGWSDWQGWHLMQVFGAHMGMASKAPFSLSIEILPCE